MLISLEIFRYFWGYFLYNVTYLITYYLLQCIYILTYILSCHMSPSLKLNICRSTPIRSSLPSVAYAFCMLISFLMSCHRSANHSLTQWKLSKLRVQANIWADRARQRERVRCVCTCMWSQLAVSSSSYVKLISCHLFSKRFQR